jgi:predicted ribosomally synthesized peptide with SipW-like signal peptide
MLWQLKRARRSRHFRLRAALAGGLVLGVAAAVTVASWTDSEFSKSTLTTSTFATQSSADGVAFASNPASPGATLAFAATAMAPTVSSFALFDVRTTAATTVAGTVQLTGATATGTLAPALEYRAIRTTTSTTCNAAAFSGTATFVAGGASTYLAATTVPGTPVASPLALGGGVIRFCFDIRVKAGAANSLQGATATVTWQFAAASN